MKKLFWFLFSFILLFGITNATTINFWLTEFDDEVWQHLYLYNLGWQQVSEFIMSTPWDISTLSYKWNISSVSWQSILQFRDVNILWNNLVYLNQNNWLFYYWLEDLFNISNLNYLWNLFSSSTYSSTIWFTFSKDWHYLYLNKDPSWGSIWIKQYYLSTPFDLSTVNTTSVSNWSILLSNTLQLSDNWEYLYVSRFSTDNAIYTLWTPWSVSWVSVYVDSFISNNIWKFSYYVYPWWTKLVTLDVLNNELIEYTCSTAYTMLWCSISHIKSLWSDYTLTKHTSVKIWELWSFLPEYSLFQTDFKTDKNLINLKFCWDYNNDDELYLMKWTTKFNWIKYWSCFEFGFVPSDTYSLHLSWWTLKKLQDWSSFSISNWTITAFNTKKLDWQVKTTIPSITSISYDETDYSYINIEVNGWLYPVVADPSKTIKLQWWNYSVSDWWYTYSFNFDKKIYFNSTISPLIVSNETIWNKDIYLNWWPYQFDNLEYLWFIPECAGWVWFTWTMVDIIELTGHLYENLTWNVFVPLHEQFLTFFFAWTNAYIMWAVILIIVIFLVRLVRLWQKWRRRR